MLDQTVSIKFVIDFFHQICMFLYLLHHFLWICCHTINSSQNKDILKIKVQLSISQIMLMLLQLVYHPKPGYTNPIQFISETKARLFIAREEETNCGMGEMVHAKKSNAVANVYHHLRGVSTQLLFLNLNFLFCSPF